ncbi:unnamed protein product [Cochlearia groenlandica]
MWSLPMIIQIIPMVQTVVRIQLLQIRGLLVVHPTKHVPTKAADDVGPSKPTLKEDHAAGGIYKHGSVEVFVNVSQKDDDLVNRGYEAEVRGDHVSVNESLTEKDSNVPDVSKEDKSLSPTHYRDKDTGADLHHTTTKFVSPDTLVMDTPAPMDSSYQKVTNLADSGLMSIFLIHATGGFEEYHMFTLIDIGIETKKLVCGLL